MSLLYFIACEYNATYNDLFNDLLNCRHNAERFSKFAFGMGLYKEEDMSGLDISTVRDYATFMALTANNQGKGGEQAVEAFLTKAGGNSSEFIATLWRKVCQESS